MKNIHYYKSQPWPHSSSLLFGFFAELDGDDETIQLEEEELSMAVWMRRGRKYGDDCTNYAADIRLSRHKHNAAALICAVHIVYTILEVIF